MSEAPSERTRVRRLPERGRYDRATIDAIFDEALVCHVAWVTDGGEPRVIPTIHVRVGDTLYFHGSTASRTLRALNAGSEVSVAATIVDGLVLARSSFHHSMNYRSAIAFGVAREVTDRDEQLAVARALADHVAPGRSADARPPTDDELRQTSMLAITLNESSAKYRVGPPVDEMQDLELPVWAGVLPLRIEPGDPLPSPDLRSGTPAPGYLVDYRRPGATS